jgi:hypothetical protein
MNPNPPIRLTRRGEFALAATVLIGLWGFIALAAWVAGLALTAAA